MDETHQFVHVFGMASTLKIIYLLQSINILYKNVFQSFMYQYNSVQDTGKCLALSLNVNVLIRPLRKN